MTTLSNRERIFASCLRLLGYGLLLISAVNLICWFPLSFDPLQEFQAAGAVIKRIPVTLLGMVLVCYCGGRGDRHRIEAAVIPILPWFCLFLAIFLLSLIPLNVVNSLRYSQNNISENAQLIEQDLVQQFEQQLEQANSTAELSAILQQQLKQPVNLSNLINTQKFKQDITIALQNGKETISQPLTFRRQKRLMLFKKCLRWNIGALIASIWFLIIGSTAKARLTKY